MLRVLAGHPPAAGADLGSLELVARGPQVMAGYLHRPEATAAMVDPDGWLRTGDLGLVDGEGNVVIVDRLKELIKVSGYQDAIGQAAAPGPGRLRHLPYGIGPRMRASSAFSSLPTKMATLEK
jgi:hypothetical protein